MTLDKKSFMDKVREEVARDQKRRIDEYDSVRVCGGCGQEIRFLILAEAEQSVITVSHIGRGGVAIRRYMVSGRWPNGMKMSNRHETERAMERMLREVLKELGCLEWDGP